jgi:hypothetical protein
MAAGELPLEAAAARARLAESVARGAKQPRQPVRYSGTYTITNNPDASCAGVAVVP